MDKRIISTSEYEIGRTTYTVTIKFNTACKEDISDVIKRLIKNDVKH